MMNRLSKLFFAFLVAGICHSQLVLATTATATAIAAGGAHTCALMSAGGVECWGNNQYGQLGNGTTTNSSTPGYVTGLSGSVVAITAGGAHTCALMSAGGVECWGNNQYGQLGNGTTTNSSTPVNVAALSSGVLAITAGDWHTCALISTGAVECWGYNLNGQLGNGTTTDTSTPSFVTNLAGKRVIAIAGGGYHTCVLTSTGGVECWGRNFNGQLGNGTTTSSATPVNVTGLSSGVIGITAGYLHTCALKSSGGVVSCWGDNADGEIGFLFSGGYQTTPVSSYQGMTAISAGDGYTCALSNTNGVECWGTNESGQLGNGTTTGGSTLVNVTGLSSGVVAIAAGGAHTCALTSGGGVECWGSNWSGQLGNDSTNNSLIPVNVTGLLLSQTITITTPAPSNAFPGSSFTVYATASSGLLVNINASGGCSGVGVGSAQITMASSGNAPCTVTYSQPGDSVNYAPAQPISSTTLTQVITVTTPAPASAAYNSSFSVAATASSGLAVAITTSGGCSGSGSGSASITMTSGKIACVVYYNQPGDGVNYGQAPQVSSTTQAVLLSQTITVTTPAPASAAYNSSFNVAATASSGLAVAITTSGGCSGSGSGSASIAMTSATTTCVVNYKQPGDGANYASASPVSSSTSATKASQTIAVTIAAPPTAAYNSTFAVAATASSGLPVSIASSGGCSGSGSGGATITMNYGNWNCTISYTQAGNGNYTAATATSNLTTATKASQSMTVTTAAPASAAYGSTFTVVATSSSGLPVAIKGSGGCSGTGSDSANITMTSGGTACVVNYNLYGNGNYLAATPMSSTTTAQAAQQSITISTQVPTRAKAGTAFTVAAEASSSLPVSITTLGSCTGSGLDSVTITMNRTDGFCAVLYNQPGNGNYAAAEEVSTITNLAGIVQNDFDGDGKSDILFVNTTTHDTQYWPDAVMAQAVVPGVFLPSYAYAGSGDFDGDGKIDLLFTRALNNGTMIWNAAVEASATYPGKSVAGFGIAAICDVNGDGKDDVVWFNPTTGGTQVWSGAVKTSINYPGKQGTAYAIAACADFDGDGRADLFWRNNTTGANEIWLSADKSTKIYPGVYTDLTWNMVGAGDVNGDGKSDVIWYHAADGKTMVWDGGLKSSSTYPGANAVAFTPAAIGDYNGDGLADLLWVNTSTDATQIWLGVVKSAVIYPGTFTSGLAVQK